MSGFISRFVYLQGIADFWVSRADLSSNMSAHIRDVIPPDEYHDHVYHINQCVAVD
jgi:trehalose/maltose hydrolase-like predicted phosphorylase